MPDMRKRKEWVRRDEQWETWATELPVSVGYQIQKAALREGLSRSRMLRQIAMEWVERQSLKAER